MASAAAANIRAFGLDRGLPFPIADIPDAEVIVLVGANPAETMPPIMQYFEEQQKRGGKLIVVDPRRTPTAKSATEHLQLQLGADSALANGWLHILVRDRLIDLAFIAARTVGFEETRRVVASYWPDRVERLTGVPVAQLERTARMIGAAKSLMIFTARGPEQQSHGVDNVLSFINIALALGQTGRPGAGYGCLTGQGNGQGGREHGQKADQLPGYRKIDNPAHRAEVAAVWGVDPDTLPRPGLSACELLDRVAGEIRAMLIMGSNPVVSAPALGSLASRLAAMDLLVVADAFLSETSALADVVLPVTQWAEEEGTMTNLEGRVIRRRRALAPPPGVRTDLEIMKAIAERLGKGEHFTDDPGEAFEELRRATSGGVADYAGISYDRVEKEDGVFWPCPSDDHPGTPRLFLESFATPDGRARFSAVEYRGADEEPDPEFPLFLTTGRTLVQYQSGTQTRRIAELDAVEPEPWVEAHPDNLRVLGIVDKDMVRVVTRRGIAEVRARADLSMRRDTLFVPFHWSGVGSANLLTNAALDPTSRIPEFKVCAARIERIS
jgi:assimilatory nitrate reductase catalytic subunit